MITIAYLQDPAHGWFEVPVSLVSELGIGREISAYSYVSRDGLTAYLEEDMDALRFHHAMQRKGIEYKTNESVCHGQSFVRRLPSWKSVASLFAAEDMPAPAPRAGQTLDLFGGAQ